MANIDYNKPKTAEDIIRRYNLDGVRRTVAQIPSIESGINKTNDELENFIRLTTNQFKDLQNQVDGNIMSWFSTGVPTLDNFPAIDWNNDEERNKHLGDLYYDDSSGYAYRFAIENNQFIWLQLSDSDIAEALALANSAKDTADQKRRIFVVQPYPPYDIGDIWLNNETSDLKRTIVNRLEEDTFHDSDWILATKYTDDAYAKQVEGVLDEFKEEVHTNYSTKTELTTSVDSINARVTAVETISKSKARIYRVQPEPPYNMGDLWFDDDGDELICIKTRLDNENFSVDDWILATKYTDDSYAKELDENIVYLQENVTEQNLTVEGIEQRVSQTEDEQGLQEQKLSETIQRIDSITNTIKIISGSNMVSNSVGLYKNDLGVIESWYITGDGTVEGGKITKLQGLTISEAGIELRNTNIKHYDIGGFVIGEKYSITFKYTNEPGSTFRFVVNNLEEFEILKSEEETELEEFVYVFTAADSVTSFFIESTNVDHNFGSLITDLIIKKSDVRCDWEPARNEIIGTTIAIYHNGMEVTSPLQDYRTRINNVGFTVSRISDNTILLSVTRDWVLLGNTEINGTLKMSPFNKQVKKIGNKHYLITS